MNIEMKRIYDDPKGHDGYRVLVDRLWPRGLRMTEVEFDLWLKDLGPSETLRKWFAHEPGKWEDFRRFYFRELEINRDLLDRLVRFAKGRKIVLLYGARDEEHNQAKALKEYLEEVLIAA
jgi:uncharacterized protein YeaO (DUF488 family)